MIYWINKTYYVLDVPNIYESYEQLKFQKHLAGPATGIGPQLSEIYPSYTPLVTQLKYPPLWCICLITLDKATFLKITLWRLKRGDFSTPPPKQIKVSTIHGAINKL